MEATVIRWLLMALIAVHAKGYVTYERRLNVAMILDVTMPISNSDLEQLKSYLKRLTSCLNIASDGNRISIALIGRSPNMILPFHPSTTHRDIEELISSLPTPVSAPPFQLPDAMLFANQSMFSSPHVRPRATNILLVIKFHPILRPNDVMTINRDFTRRGIHSFILTLGEIAPPVDGAQLWNPFVLLTVAQLSRFSGLINSIMNTFGGCNQPVEGVCELAGCADGNRSCACANGWMGRWCTGGTSGSCMTKNSSRQPSDTCACMDPSVSAVILADTSVCPMTPPCNRTRVHCRHMNTSILCGCEAGYFGSTCVTPHRCLLPPNPCRNNATCDVVDATSYKCSCAFPFVGKHCDVCGCHNGGTCVANGCTCRPNCTGDACDECGCADSICHNGGTCHNVGGGRHHCACANNCRGKDCSICPTFCERNPNICGSGGTCRDFGGTYECLCPPGCGGRNCSTCVTYCEGNPRVCLNGGTCVSTSYHSFNCACAQGCYGDTCQWCKYCERNPGTCGNGGSCVDVGKGGFMCACAQGCYGDTCQWCKYCERNPGTCGNGGSCVDVGNGGFICACAHGCSGLNCEVCPPADSCSVANNPCENGGSCRIRGNNSYICACTAPCTGVHCRDCVGYCDTHPNVCMNGGTCVNVDNGGYRCVCSSGCDGGRCQVCYPRCVESPPCYNPRYCRISIVDEGKCGCSPGCPMCHVCDPCHPNPCRNDGRCFPQPPSHPRCVCNPPFTGATCEDEPQPTCFPNPCLNGCNCVPSPAHSMGYYCSGGDGFIGKNCQIGPLVLECSAATIRLRIPTGMNFYRGRLVVGDIRHQKYDVDCIGRVSSTRGYEVRIPLPFTQCNNMIASVNHTQVISNDLWFNTGVPGAGFDAPVPIGRFRCTYSRNYQILASLTPVVSQPYPPHNEVAATSPEMTLCTSCRTTCPRVVGHPVVYTIGERIYIRVSHPRPRHQHRTTLDRMFLSCSPTPSHPHVPLVDGGCPSYRLSSTLTQPHPDVICASFIVPRMTSCNVIFIHATLKRCAQRDVELCADGSGVGRCRPPRAKRAIRAAGVVWMGPLYIIEGSRGSAQLMFNRTTSHGMDFGMRVHLNERKETTNQTSQTWITTTWYLVVICVGGTIVVITVVLVYSVVRSYLSSDRTLL